jgi:hypothetical protein
MGTLGCWLCGSRAGDDEDEEVEEGGVIGNEE